MAVQSFDLAERFQTPVFVATDLDIGMNDWMVKRFTWDDSYRPDRGKVLDAEALEKIQKFSRYLDVDGDGVAARTLPGVGGKGRTSCAARATTSTRRTPRTRTRTRRSWTGSSASSSMPPPSCRNPVFTMQEGADMGSSALGGCDAAVREAADKLRARGHPRGYHAHPRFPFGAEVKAFFDAHEQLRDRAEPRRATARPAAIELGIPRDDMIPSSITAACHSPRRSWWMPSSTFPHLPAGGVRMTSIAKPPVRHPSSRTNGFGLTLRDYEGAMSTLCAGCGHDSVTAASCRPPGNSISNRIALAR
jgi:hypothetical protein